MTTLNALTVIVNIFLSLSFKIYDLLLGLSPSFFLIHSRTCTVNKSLLLDTRNRAHGLHDATLFSFLSCLFCLFWRL